MLQSILEGCRGKLLFGQQYNGNGKVSEMADYIQFDISGLKPIDIIQKYFLYEIEKPIILLGDYEKEGSGFTQDSMLNAERIYEIKDVIESLKMFGAEILGLTLTPVSRIGIKKFGTQACFYEFVNKLIAIYQVPVFIKNTNNKELFLSTPQEVIEFTQKYNLTFDGGDLNDVCESNEQYAECYKKINWNNVKELHVKHSKLQDGKIHRSVEREKSINLNTVIEYLKIVPYATFVFNSTGIHKFEAMVQGMFDRLK